MGMVAAQGKNMGSLIIALCLFFSFCTAYCQPLRERLVSTAASQLHVREQGTNDGKEIRKYLRATGLGKGFPWCAAFVTWCHQDNNIPNPGSARVVDWFKSNVIWENDGLNDRPAVYPGYVFGLWYQNLGRLGHIGIIEYEDKNNYYTIEGNTGKSGSREGDGVHRQIRPKGTVSVLGDYCLKPKEYYQKIKQLYGTDKQD